MPWLGEIAPENLRKFKPGAAYKLDANRAGYHSAPVQNWFLGKITQLNRVPSRETFTLYIRQYYTHKRKPLLLLPSQLGKLPSEKYILNQVCHAASTLIAYVWKRNFSKNSFFFLHCLAACRLRADEKNYKLYSTRPILLIARQRPTNKHSPRPAVKSTSTYSFNIDLLNSLLYYPAQGAIC